MGSIRKVQDESAPVISTAPVPVAPIATSVSNAPAPSQPPQQQKPQEQSLQQQKHQEQYYKVASQLGVTLDVLKQILHQINQEVEKAKAENKTLPENYHKTRMVEIARILRAKKGIL